ncbi:LmeA family phospholipid-binding protein [Kineococcus sp. SYSU DK002]|uniref:LmeA family phospholipid-binding protein n=1 Tax=Kineococcus sp. SYSU DK002 TaxID=3383123 RepID=UPI003D7F0196
MSRRPRLLPLVVTVLALAVIAVAADLGARTWATGRVAQEVRREYGLDADPRVEVAGGSFLWQAARGRFDDVTITADRFPTTSVTARDLRVRLSEVDVPAGVLAGRGGTVDLGAGTVRALVPFDELAARVPGDLPVRLTRSGDAVRAAARVRVFTASLDLAVTGRPVLDGAAVRLEPVSAELAGAQVPLRRAQSLLELAGFGDWSIPLEGVPAQVRLQDLRVVDDGVLVSGSLVPGAVDVG